MMGRRGAAAVEMVLRRFLQVFLQVPSALALPLSCDVPHHLRVPCKHPGACPSFCPPETCCLDGQSCYQGSVPLLVAHDHQRRCNSVPVSQRRPCGWPGVSAADCEALNCCYHGDSCFRGDLDEMQDAVTSQQRGGVASQQRGGAASQQRGGVASRAPEEPPTLFCAVPVGARVPCGGPGTSAEKCGALNCCHDDQGCYFADAVSVQCTKDGFFVVVVSRSSTSPPLHLPSLSLRDHGCSFADANSRFVIYHFSLTACGSSVWDDSGAIVYENFLSSSYEAEVGPRGSVTRDSQFQLLFQCRYSSSSVRSVVVEVAQSDDVVPSVAGAGPVNVRLRLGNGRCRTKGCDPVSAAFSSFVSSFPLTVALKDSVFVEVQLLGRTDPSLALVLDRCWVTASPNPHSAPQWDILIQGCPNTDDRYRSSLIDVAHTDVNFPSHHRRFSFSMFTFIDPNDLSNLSEQIFVHCSSFLCEARPGGSCDPLCYTNTSRYGPGRRRRRNTEAETKGKPNEVSSLGPILIFRTS